MNRPIKILSSKLKVLMWEVLMLKVLRIVSYLINLINHQSLSFFEIVKLWELFKKSILSL